MFSSGLTVIHAGKVIDATGAPPRGDSWIVLKGDRIEAVLPANSSTPLPEDARRIDLSAFTVLPGLINTHAHVALDATFNCGKQFHEDSDTQMISRMIGQGLKALRSGTTTVKDNGGRGPLGIQYRDHVNSGIVYGPRLLMCGDTISNEPTAPYDRAYAKTPDEVRRVVREQFEAGADFVHMAGAGGRLSMSGKGRRSARFDVAAFEAAVNEAQKRGSYVAVDSHATEGIRNAAVAGARTVEHAHFLGEKDGIDASDEILRLLSDRGVYVIPTLAISYQRTAPTTGDFEPTLAKDEMLGTMEHRCGVLKSVHDAGIKLVAGSDAGGYNTPFDEYAWEFELLAKCGLSPMEVIQSGTKVAAECIGWSDRIGTIEQGKFADLIAVSGDPLVDIKALWNVERVFLGGKEFFDRAPARAL
jgi:imidazolonepropionase-like amidohydrolase